jgi:hypothetical protein
VLHFLLDLLHCPLMLGIFLEHEMQGLANTGCFDPFHQCTSQIKIQRMTTGFTHSATRCIYILFQNLSGFKGDIEQIAPRESL